MIHVTRRFARDLKTVFRRALGFTRYCDAPPVELSASENGVIFRAKNDLVAVEYRDLQAREPCRIVVPMQLFQDCEGGRDQQVTIEPPRDGHVFCRWQDGDVPQLHRYEHDQEFDSEFPEVPAQWESNPPGLLAALRDAVNVTDPEPTRYALSNMQLRGASGTIVATDGRQLLYQEGFQFPWDEDVLASRTNAFDGKELPSEEPVAIGKTDDWITVRVQPWTFHLHIDKAGRFPRTDENLPKQETMATRLRIADADRRFLLRSLRRLPCDDEMYRPITLDLNGEVAVRATDAEQPQPTEILLRNSQREGEPSRINMNREYLARAVEMGFEELHISDPQAPVFCFDEKRKYLWAPLDPDSAVPPHENAIRIESSVQPPGRTSPGRRRRTKPTMTRSPKQDKPDTTGNGRATTAAGDTRQEGTASALEQATALRTSLRDAVNKASELIRTLKREQKQSKLVRSTLASLKQIQAVEV